MKICSVCGKEIKGFGNNPYPLKTKGECCNDCNDTIVIPIRILMSKGMPFVINKQGISVYKPQGETFTLTEMQNAVGGYVQIAPKLCYGNYVLVNEEGLIRNLYRNDIATLLVGMEFFGNVLITPKRFVE